MYALQQNSKLFANISKHRCGVCKLLLHTVMIIYKIVRNDKSVKSSPEQSVSLRFYYSPLQILSGKVLFPSRRSLIIPLSNVYYVLITVDLIVI